MKRFFAVAALTVAGSSFAAADRAIYDIMYLPSMGTSYGFTEVGYLTRDIKGTGTYDDVDVSGYGIEQTVGHSLTDKLTINLNLNYVNGEIESDGDSIDQQGISDPVVNGRFRLMDEDMKLDLIGGLVMSLGEAEIDNNNDRDNKQGGNAMFGGVQFGQKKDENLQWAVLAQYRRNFERKYEVDIGPVDVDVKFKPNNEYLLRADLLNKLGDVSFLRTHAFIEISDKVDAKTSGVSSLFGPTTIYELGTEYDHLLSQDLMAKARVDYRIDSSNTGNYNSDRAWAFTVGANYQF